MEDQYMTKWQIVLDLLMCLSSAAIIFFAVKQGFIKSFFKYTKMLIVIILTIVVGAALVGVCSDHVVEPALDGKVSNILVNKAEQYGDGFTFETLTEDIPSVVKKIVPMSKIEAQFDKLSGNGVEVADKLGEKIEGVAISIISKIIAYFGTFVFAYIGCTIGVKLLEKSCEIPVVGGVNRILGFIWGAAHAYVFVSLAVCFVVLIMGGDYVEGTKITRLIYKFGLFTH